MGVQRLMESGWLASPLAFLALITNSGATATVNLFLHRSLTVLLLLLKVVFALACDGRSGGTGG